MADPNIPHTPHSHDSPRDSYSSRPAVPERSGSSMPYIIGAVVVVLLVVLFAIFSGGGGGESTSTGETGTATEQGTGAATGDNAGATGETSGSGTAETAN